MNRVIVGAYVDSGALDRACSNCGAEPAEWCRTLDGTDRRVPCVARAPKRDTTDDPDDTAPAARSFDEPLHGRDAW